MRWVLSWPSRWQGLSLFGSLVCRFFVSLWVAVVVQFRSLSLGEQINRLGKSSGWYLLIVAHYRLGFVFQTANRREYPESAVFIGEQYVRVDLPELYIRKRKSEKSCYVCYDVLKERRDRHKTYIAIIPPIGYRWIWWVFQPRRACWNFAILLDCWLATAFSSSTPFYSQQNLDKSSRVKSSASTLELSATSKAMTP